MIQQHNNDWGGEWTIDKLERIKKYLEAYTKILSKTNFRFAYIDAFSGTGYRNIKSEINNKEILFPELTDKETEKFLDSSVRIALQTKPRFTKYIFIEKDDKKCQKLNNIKLEFNDKKNDIIIVNADANNFIFDLCSNYNWRKNRAVLFLDPYGMQVDWKTIESIAKTNAIDLWILFPLGIGVNRLLKKDGNIFEGNKNRLDRTFGTNEWFHEFYNIKEEKNLFEIKTKEYQKVVDFDKISKFFIKRLKTIFHGVAENPLKLINSKKNPLFLLCFASSNPKGSKIAIKIAEHILKRN